MLSGTTTAAAAAGLATLSGLSINKIGSGYTLRATSPGILSATSNSFNITPGVATSFNVTGITSPVTAGVSSTVTVEPKDGQGNRVTNYTGTVTFSSTDSQATIPGNYTFTGADNGIHSFSSGVVLKTAGTQSITATDNVSTSVTGSQSNVTVLPASGGKLAFSVAPSNTAYGAIITPGVQVTVQDTFGNTATGATNVVTLGIGTNPSTGTLGGTVSVAAVAGVATFSTLNIDKAGNGYTLAASASGLTGATSAAFNVSDATPPVISSAITPGVTTGTVGDVVVFTFSVSDNQAVTYVWDFGDGSTATTSGSSQTHTFSVAGTFTVSVTATDSSGNSVTSSITFTVVAASTGGGGGGGGGTPSDICDGLNPVSFALLQVSAKLKFPSSLSKDSLTLKGVIQLNDGFNPLGQEVKWEIGGILGTTTLDAKGSSPTSSTTKVSVKFKKPAKGLPFTSAPAKLTITLKALSLSELTLAGVPVLNASSANKTGDSAAIKVCVVLTKHQAYHDENKSGLYKATKDKAASFTAK